MHRRGYSGVRRAAGQSRSSSTIGRLFVGKEATHRIERNHACQRHWLARLRRRSIVVCRAKRMVDASITMFAAFGGTDKLQDLLSMLT